jgi:hypothetical protein
MNIEKLKPGNSGILYSKWFANKREAKAKKFLLKRKDGISTTTPIGIDILILSKEYADEAREEIERTLFEIMEDGKSADYIYFLAYYEYNETTLESAILFKILRSNLELLLVPYMSIFYQGAQEKFKDGYTEKRKLVHKLFKHGLCHIKEKYDQLTTLEINAASMGSQEILKKIWRGVDGANASEIRLPLENICAECRLNSPIYTFEKVGGSFCSKRCAKKHWIKISRRYIRFKIK